jgi:hypothetical protein
MSDELAESDEQSGETAVLRAGIGHQLVAQQSSVWKRSTAL